MVLVPVYSQSRVRIFNLKACEELVTLLFVILQEIEAMCGEALCRLFPPDENIDLRAIALKARRARRSAPSTDHHHPPRERPFGGPRRMEPPRLGLLLFGLISYYCAHGLVAT